MSAMLSQIMSRDNYWCRITIFWGKQHVLNIIACFNHVIEFFFLFISFFTFLLPFLFKNFDNFLLLSSFNSLYLQERTLIEQLCDLSLNIYFLFSPVMWSFFVYIFSLFSSYLNKTSIAFQATLLTILKSLKEVPVV